MNNKQDRSASPPTTPPAIAPFGGEWTDAEFDDAAGDGVDGADVDAVVVEVLSADVNVDDCGEAGGGLIGQSRLSCGTTFDEPPDVAFPDGDIDVVGPPGGNIG